MERTVSPKQTETILEHMILAQTPVMLYGAPGLGKSEIIQSIGNRLDRNVIDIRLAMFSELDIRGLPKLDHENDLVKWCQLGIFPTDPDATDIILFDEITQANPSVQGAALQLILNRQIGEYHLPKGVSIVAAGNRPKDKTGAKTMISALRNRFVQLTIESNFDDWREWAMANRVHPQVVGFLSHRPQYLDTFNPDSAELAYATPRSWVHFVSKTLYNESFPQDYLTDVIAGAVGESVAIEFMAVRNLLVDLPKPEDILSGKVKTLKEKGVAAQYSLITSCTYLLKEAHDEKEKMPAKSKEREAADAEWFKMADNFVWFGREHFKTEMLVLAIMIAITQLRLRFSYKKMPNYNQFFQDNKDVLNRAGA